LREIPLSDVLNKATPIQKIKTEEDVELWKTTRSYSDLGLFLQRLNEAVVGHYLPFTPQRPSKHVASVLSILDKLDTWIDEAPPLQTPQRFGNLAFRTWGKRVEDNAGRLLSAMLPVELHPAIPYLSPYFLTSFGSFQRMDYGSGHETSFTIFLLCLSLLRFFVPERDEERQVVLLLFVRYLQLCWRLQDVYNLEPAGSHGVWGLDDYSFLGYIFGSGQLCGQTEISIMRIHEFKHGPFHEHSSQLHSIAVGVPSWSKVNSGLFKMYQAEVLGKRVVVQHIPLGGLMEWEPSVTQSHRGLSVQSLPALSR